MVLTPAALPGQTFHFTDGKSATVPPARISGTSIVIPLKGSGEGTAEITQPLARIARMDWPAPAAVAQAADAFAAGLAADALKLLDSVLPGQEPFRDIPGSWWPHAAGLKAEALARLGREVDAEVMLERLRRAKKPDASVISRVELALLETVITKRPPAAVRARLAELAEATTDDAALARLALLSARLDQAEGKDEQALLACLRVPVLYPNEVAQLPAALLGAATAYRALGEASRAQATWQSVVERFPLSPEAVEARRELGLKK